MPVKNDEEFRAWLEEQPRAVCTAIAYRAAMRVFPRVGQSPSAVLYLRMVRSLIVTACFAVRSDAFDKSFLSGSFHATAADTFSSYADAVFSAHFATFDDKPDAAAASAVHASTRERAEGYSADDDQSNTLSWSHHLWRQLEADILFVEQTGPEDLSRAPLWSQSGHPPEFSQAYEEFIGFSRSSDQPWSFWAKWYDRAMAGDPLPWDLQEQIALIPNEVWDAGPEAVEEEIARIEEEFSGPPLDNAAAALEAQRLASAPTYFADIFDSSSISVSYHVDLFLKKADLNTLPDGFQALDKVSASFASLAEVLRQSDDNVGQIAALKVELKAANAVIQELRRELRETRQALLSASHSPAEASRLRRLGQAALATIFTAAAFGGIASGIEAGFQLNDRRLASYEALRTEAEALAHTMEGIEATDLEPKKPDT